MRSSLRARSISSAQFRRMGLAAKLQRDDLAGPFAEAGNSIVLGDVAHLAVVGHPAQQDVGIRKAGVVIDRDPVEPVAQVGVHLVHQTARGLPQVGQHHPLLGGDDQAELEPIFPTPVKERGAISHVLVGGTDLVVLAIADHAVAFQIAQMRVHRHAADELPPARCTARFPSRPLPVERCHAPDRRMACCTSPTKVLARARMGRGV